MSKETVKGIAIGILIAVILGGIVLVQVNSVRRDMQLAARIGSLETFLSNLINQGKQQQGKTSMPIKAPATQTVKTPPATEAEAPKQ